jgi:hypothetical protein
MLLLESRPDTLLPESWAGVLLPGEERAGAALGSFLGGAPAGFFALSSADQAEVAASSRTAAAANAYAFLINNRLFKDILLGLS